MPWDLIFLCIYIFFLPIAHVATIQAISSVLFAIYVVYKYNKNFSLEYLKPFKSLWIALGIYTFLAFLSLIYTPDKIETLKEIKGELLEHIFFLIIFFFYALNISQERFKKILWILFVILTFHNIVNIIIWIKHGGWPFRAGALLDTPGGERFGIWITYTLGLYLGICKYYFPYGIIFLIFIFISIIANQGPTLVASVMVLFGYIYFFIKNKLLKTSLILVLIIPIVCFYWYSKNLSAEYGIYNFRTTIESLNLVLKLPPKEFDKLPLVPSVYERLSMWKSALLYKFKHPFVPEGFGRFLYGKSIKQKFKNSHENLPVTIYPQVHNDFIGTFYSLGLIGLIAFCYILYYKLKVSLKFFRFSEDTYEKIFGIFVFLGTIGFIGSSIFCSNFGDSEAKFFFLIYGLLLGRFYRLTKNKKVLNF